MDNVTWVVEYGVEFAYGVSRGVTFYNSLIAQGLV